MIKLSNDAGRIAIASIIELNHRFHPLLHNEFGEKTV